MAVSLDDCGIGHFGLAAWGWCAPRVAAWVLVPLCWWWWGNGVVWDQYYEYYRRWKHSFWWLRFVR